MAAISSSTSAHPRAVRGGSFSRTGRGSSGWIEAGPGPGAYQRVDQASRATLHSQPAFSFSSGRNARTRVPSSRLLAEWVVSAWVQNVVGMWIFTLVAGTQAHACPLLDCLQSIMSVLGSAVFWTCRNPDLTSGQPCVVQRKSVHMYSVYPWCNLVQKTACLCRHLVVCHCIFAAF